MSWENDLDGAWAAAATAEPEALRAEIARIVADPAVPAEVRQFELGGAFDSTGDPRTAVAHYREALQLGLTGERRVRATIQLASSLRNLGQPAESVALLTDIEPDAGDLSDAVAVFLALALADLGRERNAISLLVHALAEHLPRYRVSAHGYADELG